MILGASQKIAAAIAAAAVLSMAFIAGHILFSANEIDLIWLIKYIGEFLAIFFISLIYQIVICVPVGYIFPMERKNYITCRLLVAAFIGIPSYAIGVKLISNGIALTGTGISMLLIGSVIGCINIIIFSVCQVLVKHILIRGWKSS